MLIALKYSSSICKIEPTEREIMTTNILKSLARNHPEDTVSDVLCELFNSNEKLKKGFLKNFIKSIDDYEIISINRNFSLTSKLRPDITFLLRKKGSKKINYYHIETKIEANENKYGQGRRTQFAQYSKNMTKNIRELRHKCVLLCPSYIEGHNENNCQRYVISDLINLLEECFIKNESELASLLINYLKEECEITDYEELDAQNFNFIKSRKRNEFKKILSGIRVIMLDIVENGNSMKSGDWRKDQCSYFFGLNLKRKRTRISQCGKWEKRDAFLAYEYGDEVNCKSPLIIYFPEHLFNDFRIMNPHYNGNSRYYFHVFEDPANIKLLNKYGIKDKDRNRLSKYVKYALDKKKVIEEGNKFLRNTLRFINMLDTILMEKNYVTTFNSDFRKNKMIYKMRIKKRTNSRKYLDIAFDPISEDDDLVLRWESNVKFRYRTIEHDKLFYCSLSKKYFNDVKKSAEFIDTFLNQ